MNKILALIVLTFTFCYGAVVNACVSEGLGVGLVAHYKFNNNANDEMATNNATAYNITSSTNRICSENSAYSFNGTDSYIEKMNPTSSLNIGSNSWSVSAWIKTNSSDYMEIVSHYECGWNPYCGGAPDAALYELTIINGDIEWFVRDDNGGRFLVDTNGLSLNNGKWHHIVGVLNRNTSKTSIYVDSELIIQGSCSGITTISDAGSPLEIGRVFIRGWGSPDLYFSGNIDDVRIYNRALSDCEVAELYYKD